jgi:hemoglobin
MSNSINNEIPAYGFMDTSYKAAGSLIGINLLCQEFYHLMETLLEAKHIREMHTDDLTTMIDKLTLFFGMWLGGPKTYKEKYHFQGMPTAHQHLLINEIERDAWLLCMDLAIDKQPYVDSFKAYLKKQIRFPAEMIMKNAR